MDSSEKRPRRKAVWVAGAVAGLALAGGGSAAVAAASSGHGDAGRQRQSTVRHVTQRASPSCSAGATGSLLPTPVPSPTASTATPVPSPTASTATPVPSPTASFTAEATASPSPTSSLPAPVASPTAVPTRAG